MRIAPGAIVVAAVIVLVCVSRAAAICEQSGDWEHYTGMLCGIAKTRLCWSVQDNTLRIAMEAKVTGYMSLAMGPSSWTGEFDLAYLWVDSAGYPHAEDYHGFNFDFSTYSHSGSSSIKRDREQNLYVVSGEVIDVSDGSNGGASNDGVYMSVVFERRLTDDANFEDYPIDPTGETGIIWSTNKDTPPTSDSLCTEFNFVPHSGNRGNKGWTKITVDDSNDVLSCEFYCQVLDTACGADGQEHEAQYLDSEHCLQQCTEYLATGAWALGSGANTNDNSLACRLFQAHQAEAAPPHMDDLRFSLCNAAGPSGGNICGTWCVNYCSYAMAHCPDNFADYDHCRNACGGFPTGDFLGSNDPNYARPNIPYYDTVQCRITHAAEAVDNVAFPHFPENERCNMSSIVSTDTTCATDAAPSCAYYCDAMVHSCGSDRATCMAECGTRPAGTFGDYHGNTVGCLMHLAEDTWDQVSCADAADGGSLCVDEAQPCDLWCHGRGQHDLVGCRCRCEYPWTAADDCSQCALTCEHGNLDAANCHCDCEPLWSGMDCSLNLTATECYPALSSDGDGGFLAGAPKSILALLVIGCVILVVGIGIAVALFFYKHDRGSGGRGGSGGRPKADGEAGAGASGSSSLDDRLPRRGGLSSTSSDEAAGIASKDLLANAAKPATRRTLHRASHSSDQNANTPEGDTIELSYGSSSLEGSSSMDGIRGGAQPPAGGR